MNHTKTAPGKIRYICKVAFFISLLIILDQFTKLSLIRYFGHNINKQYITIFPFLTFFPSWNYGISFGMFGGHEYSNIFFLTINTVIIAYLFYYLRSLSNKLQIISLYFIISGAIGNIIDRIIHGGVFDFISFHYQNYYFPSFNVADTYISLGACIFIISMIYAHYQGEKS